MKMDYQHYSNQTVGLLSFEPKVGHTPSEHAQLLCIPFGGGSPLSFQKLSEQLEGQLHVKAIDPPGHVRTRGTPFTCVDRMAACYLSELPEESFRSGYVYGHSLGAYVALRIAFLLEKQGKPLEGIVLAGCQAPHLRDPNKPLTKMSDEETYQWIRFLNQSSGEDSTVSDAERRELFEVFKQAIRSDCQAFENFDARNIYLTKTQALVLNGSHDDYVKSSFKADWSNYIKTLDLKVIESAPHLFVASHAQTVAGLIKKWITSLPATPVDMDKKDLARVGQSE
ncbi:MAG: thioesterase [Limnobacter sp.]|nr:thioesterase [Limnobacter sp.]